MYKPLLIVGVDPGTTVGYAVLDLKGTLVALGSGKEISLDHLIQKIIQHGKVLLVATDKKKVPTFVEKFRTKTGSRIIPLKEDLKVADKNELTKPYPTKNSHEADALASALTVKNAIKNSLNQLEHLYRESLSDNDFRQLIALQFLNPEKNIKKSALLLEASKTSLKEPEKKILPMQTILPKDPSVLLQKTQKLEQDYALLRHHNKQLMNYIQFLKKKEKKLKEKLHNTQETKTTIDHHMPSLLTELHHRKQQAEHIKAKLDHLRTQILSQTAPLVLKRLKNLGKEEFDRKKNILQIKRGDILLVDDPTVVSASTIDHLKAMITTIVVKKSLSNKNRDLYPFIFLPADQLNLIEDEFFALTDLQHFKTLQEKANILQKVLQDYHQERKDQISSVLF